MYSTYENEEIEQLRKRSRLFKKLKGLMTLSMILIMVASLVVAYHVMIGRLAQSMMPILFVSWFVGLGLLIFLGYMAAKSEKAFKSLYKSRFVSKIIKENLEQGEFVTDQGFTRQRVDDFQLIFPYFLPFNLPTYRYCSEDYVRANYQGVTFEQSDVTIRIRKKNGSKRTPFKGRIMKISGLPNQRADVQIFSHNFKHRASSVNGQPMVYGLIVPAGAHMPGRIQMADEEFNKQFDVYPTNEWDTLNFLSPSMTEALKRLKNKYTSVGIRLVGNEAYVALNAKRDTFECNARKPIDYEAEKMRVLEDINETKKVIEIFL